MIEWHRGSRNGARVSSAQQGGIDHGRVETRGADPCACQRQSWRGCDHSIPHVAGPSGEHSQRYRVRGPRCLDPAGRPPQAGRCAAPSGAGIQACSRLRLGEKRGHFCRDPALGNKPGRLGGAPCHQPDGSVPPIAGLYAPARNRARRQACEPARLAGPTDRDRIIFPARSPRLP